MSQQKQLLQYYQGKVDELYKQRLMWLSRFDECSSQLQQKQRLMDRLKDQKDKQMQLYRGIVYHDVALLDEKINVNRMERDNINNQYADAEEVLKIEQLAEEYPNQLEKRLPCKIWAGNQIIDNELNIHSKQKKNIKKKGSVFRQNNYVLKNQTIVEGKALYRPTAEELLKRQIIELKANQDKQITLLEEQTKKIQNLIKKVKKREENTLNQERKIVKQLENDLKKQETRHQAAAEKYFSARKKLKEEHQSTLKQNQKLRQTLKNLETRLAKEEQHYERENKAKQTLIVRRSQDFEEDYKARMRAKQRNLQALRDNYQKMQQVCIEKISTLENTLRLAKQRLKEAEDRRDDIIGGLKAELNVLEKQDREERLQKIRLDMQIKEKLEQDKRRRQELEKKEEQARRRFAKDKLIPQAYKTTKKASIGNTKSKSKQKSDKKSKRKSIKNDESEQSEEESLQMSDLQNIRQQINRLENKIEAESKSKV